ncbi:MAG: transposase [Chitinophagaceae bacterium]|nr:transposase [Chitinophagaceae bacterium]
MKKQTRRKFNLALKAKVALEAVKNQKTLAELAKEFDINPVMISKWKAEFIGNLSATFEKSDNTDSKEIDSKELYATIDKLQVENDFFKKKLQEVGNQDLRILLIQPRNSKISIRKQCELLSVNRSRVYYKPVDEKPENIEMMNIMDRHLTKHPIEGVKSMTLKTFCHLFLKIKLIS